MGLKILHDLPWCGIYSVPCLPGRDIKQVYSMNLQKLILFRVLDKHSGRYILRKKLLLVALGFLLILVSSQSLFAYGLGAYFNGGIGESRLKRYYLYMMPPMYLDFYFKGMNYVYGAGFVFDTCVADNSLFNYRLQVGFDEFRYPKTPDIIWAEYNYIPELSHGHAFRLSMKNTFGFAFFRNRLFRAWAGISISSVYYPNNLSSGDYNIIIPRLFTPGIALGLNYHFHESLSFIAECGLTYEWSAPRDRLDYMNSLNGYLSVGVLFRLKKSKDDTLQRHLMLIPDEEIKKKQASDKENLKEEVFKKEKPDHEKDL